MPFRRNEFLRVAGRLAAEQGAAIDIVNNLRSRLPLLGVQTDIPESWRTIGVVEELCSTARELLPTAPSSSVTAAKLATSIANVLDDDYPRVLRSQAMAHAWCTLAEVWREAGDANASLQAVETAREALAKEPALVEERALVDLAEGLTLMTLGAFADARKRLIDANRIFNALGRSDLVMRAKESIAAIETATTSSPSG